MAPKRAASASGKARKKRAPALDWRTPLFYWRGTVDDETWSGAWVASTDGLPSDADFEASENSFKLKCSEPIGMLVTLSDTAEKAPTAMLTGSYKLDNGGGLDDYSDVEHKICAIEGPPCGGPLGESEWVNVAARGTTEFGEFVSLGKMVRLGDGSHVLTLARRYIADDDPRCKMSEQDVLARVVTEEVLDYAHIETPWTALPWRVADDWPAPIAGPPEAAGSNQTDD
eukprot:3859214-Prymnesium_polylepis.4